MTSPWHPSVPLCACKQGDCAHPVLVQWLALAGKKVRLTITKTCQGRVYKSHWRMQCSVQTCTHNHDLIPSELHGIVCVDHILSAQESHKERQSEADRAEPAPVTVNVHHAASALVADAIKGRNDAVKPHRDEKDEYVRYEARAHLSVWRAREWVDRGTGKIKILFHPQTKRVRVVMRADNTKQVCLNLPVDPELTIGHSGEKGRVWTDYDAVDEPPVMRSFRADFETPEMAYGFTAMMDMARDYLKENRIKTDGVVAVQKQQRIPAASAAAVDPVHLETTSLQSTQKQQRIPAASAVAEDSARFKPTARSTLEADDPIKALIRAIADLSAHRRSRLGSEVTSITSVLAQDVIATWPEIECLFEVYGWNSACKQFDGGVDMDGLQSLARELSSNNLHSILNQLSLE